MIMDVSRVTAPFEEIEKQAGMSTRNLMVDGRKAIDEEFGKGYAAKHPELLAAFLRAGMANMANADSLKVYGDILDGVVQSIDLFTDSVDKVAAGLNGLSEIASAVEELSTAVASLVETDDREPNEI